MDQLEGAAVVPPLRQVKRAAGLLREVVRSLSSLVDGDADIVGVKRVHDPESADSALELINLETARHGAVDVVVIASPPPRPARAKESSNGSTHVEGSPRPRA